MDKQFQLQSKTKISNQKNIIHTSLRMGMPINPAPHLKKKPIIPIFVKDNRELEKCNRNPKFF